MTSNKRLIVLTGPTGVGKTDLSIALAKHLDAPIISADSRQFFREMKIGTAPPAAGNMAKVPHYFIHCRSVTENYNAGEYAADALGLLDELFDTRDNVLMVGGSGMYVDAVCYGFDELPDTDPALRAELSLRFDKKGLEPLLEHLKELDPEYYEQVDRDNHARVIRALEVCISSGQPYSKLRRDEKKERGFSVLKIGLELLREELYDRINKRVDLMMEAGLLEEAKALYPFRNLTALRTVGYSELFDYMDGKTSLEEAVELIKRNSRRYAKRQMTWFRRDRSIKWFLPTDLEKIKKYVDGNN